MAGKRVTKEQWLQGALDFVVDHGVFGMTPDRLAKSLATSRSSYYWHFGTQEEFRRQVVEFWAWKYTTAVAEQLSAHEGSPEDRLKLVFELVRDSGINTYEGAVNALAYGDDSLVEKVRETYRSRQATLKSILEDMNVRKDRQDALSMLLMASLTWKNEMGYSRTPRMDQEYRRLVFELVNAMNSGQGT